MRSSLAGICLTVLSVVLPAQAAAVPAGKLDDAEYARLLRLLTPPADAPWRTVPWRTELLTAQREAASTGKPLFVWAMDGHPLTCV